MTTATPTFLGRSDTFFGVCEAIGQDVGFNANWLRIALGLGVLFAPVTVIALYALLALVVVTSRLLFPIPAARTARATVPTSEADNDDAVALPLAA